MTVRKIILSYVVEWVYDNKEAVQDVINENDWNYDVEGDENSTKYNFEISYKPFTAFVSVIDESTRKVDIVEG